MKIAAFAGVLGTDSVSKKLVREAVRLLEEESGLAADYLDLKEHSLSIYDSDVENAGVPEAINQLGLRIGKADALVIAAPEYNGGISSVLKTLVDWLSRLKPNPLSGKYLLLIGASPGGSGGAPGLWHTRVPFEALGVHVFPLMVAVPRAHTAFSKASRLVDEKSEKKLRQTLSAFVQHVADHHPLKI